MSPARKRYFLGIEERSATLALAMEQRATRGKSDLAIRLENVQAYVSGDSFWPAGFLKSLIEQELTRGTLSSKQLELLSKIESENNADTARAAIDWHSQFATDPTTQLQWHRAMMYYRSNAPYHKYHVQIWFEDSPEGRVGSTIDPLTAPSLKEFNKVISNNYVQKVLAGYETAPAFAVGAMVTLRSSASFTAISKTGGRPCIVMNNTLPIVTASKGNRRYRLLPVGSAQMLELQEKHIKTFRAPKKKKRKGTK
jgi:hypothetical protein